MILSYPKYKREDKLSSKFSDKEVKEIKKLYKSGKYTFRYIAKLFNVSHSTIYWMIYPKKLKRIVKERYHLGKIQQQTKESSTKSLRRKQKLLGKKLNHFHYMKLKERGYFNRPDVKEKLRERALKYYYKKKITN